MLKFRSMKRLAGLCCFATLAWAFFSCQEKMGPAEVLPQFALQPVSVPTVINRNKPTWYTVQFRVEHPLGIEAVDSVWATFRLPGDNLLFQLPLFDDGQAVHPATGDVVARDGIYSNRFLSTAVSFPQGEVHIQAFARDRQGMEAASAQLVLQAVDNLPPRLLSITAPDTLPAGSQPLLFAALVLDSNATADLQEVYFTGWQNGLPVFQVQLPLLQPENERVAWFGVYLDSTFAAERKGEYLLRFQATDRSGEIAPAVEHSIFLENTPPWVFEPRFRDTLQRPSQGVDTLRVQIRANDRQGLGDLLQVSFVVELVGGTASSPVEMFDDGNLADHGDAVAGDGRFARIISLSAQNQAGTYLLHFSARDRVGQSSAVVTDTLVVLP